MPRRNSSSLPGSERIKQFKVVRRLGKGAFGTVFQVVRKSDGQNYALKKVNISNMSKREIEDALNEIRFLASVKHPNVVGFLEAFLNERSMELCIVMEFADGGDLSAKIEKAQKSRRYLDEPTVWRYFLQLMEGVICLHEHKVLHRDLKTANCFLTVDGHLKIGDLNVSKLARMGLVKTQIGTPYYMSPEIWQNRPYNDKSDIWSVGCILYEMCALRPPFRGRDLEDLAKRVQAGYYPRIPSQFSSDLDTTIRQLLAQDARRRPNAKQVMELPQVKRRIQEHKKALMGTLISNLHDEKSEMLATIHVPRNIRRISHQLPKPAYPDMRPSSPSAWPVSAKGRAQELDRRKQGGAHVPPTIGEEDEGKRTSVSEPKRSRRPGLQYEPTSRSDPMGKPKSALADIRAAARDEVGANRHGYGGRVPGVKKYQPHRIGSSASDSEARNRGGGRHGPSGYVANARGGYGHNAGGYGHAGRAAAAPRVVAHAGRHGVGGRGSGSGGYQHARQQQQQQHGGGYGYAAKHKQQGYGSPYSADGANSRVQAGQGHPHVRNPYRHNKPRYKQQSGYAANYHSPYGQASQAAAARGGYAKPQRYSGNAAAVPGLGGAAGAGRMQRHAPAPYSRRSRASNASVASSVYSGYRNRGGYSHRSNASRPSWWG